VFNRILIANRGEIALRVLRACRELGIQTVMVYSKADEDAVYLRHADETICIGPGVSGESYLSIPNIISAAEIADVDAIHPGYGFLAENAHFAEICRTSNIEFIGPTSEVVQMMGDKAQARFEAEKAGIPVVPGSSGTVSDEEEALAVAREIGYPVLIKASAGGGGRGMRLAHNDISLVNSIHAARAEAEAAFGDGTLYMEKWVDKPRHVEVQILGDKFGNIVHLHERDCSVQRRNQKVVEEAPCASLPKDVRKKLHRAAVKLAKAVGFENAGTVEFILDSEDRFFFIEVNARIQVEHPVTEMITGIDLVKEQLRIASGEKLAFTQDQVKVTGHSIECRINAEDPDDNYRPCPGKVTSFIPPGGGGVRMDTHVYSGYRVPSLYDSLLGKLIVTKPTREEAIATMKRALDEFVVEGIKTNLPLHRRILRNSVFVEGNYNTAFLETYLLRS
jgi:acetyl-CoA carboxylase, biotin carboxylase subunit